MVKSSKPIISYDENSTRDAQAEMERRRKMVGTEPAVPKEYDEERPKRVPSARIVKSTPLPSNEAKQNEEVILNAEEDHKEDATPEASIDPITGVKVMKDSHGNEIPVDETLDDPFINIEGRNPEKVENDVTIKEDTQVAIPVSVPSKDKDDEVIVKKEQPPIKEEKKQSKVKIAEEEEVVIQLSPDGTEIGKVSATSGKTSGEEDGSVIIEKEVDEKKTPKQDLTEGSLVDIHGNERPFMSSGEENTSNVDIFEGIETPASLGDIEVIDSSNLLEVSESVDRIFESPVFQVTALKSCYVAFMRSLTFKDRDIFNRSNVDRNTHNQNLFRMVYDCMDHCSIKNSKISYNDFLRVTAWEDLQTLLFGIYRQSFPGENEIIITCDNCQKQSRIKVNPDRFIVTKNDEATREIQDLIRELNGMPNMTASDVMKKSFVSKIRRFALPHSHIVVDVLSPSLSRFLDITGYYSRIQDQVEAIPTLASTIIFIDKLLVPNIPKSRQRGKLVYDKIEKLPDIINILGKLDSEDEFRLKERIMARRDKYSVDYKVRNVVCPACRETIGDMDADLESILFFANNLAVNFRTLDKRPSES